MRDGQSLHDKERRFPRLIILLLIFLSCAMSVNATLDSTNMRACYPFDGNYSNALGNTSLDGTALSGRMPVPVASGKRGTGSYYFDGSARIDFAAFFLTTSSETVAFWMRNNGSGNYEQFMIMGNGTDIGTIRKTNTGAADYAGAYDATAWDWQLTSSAGAVTGGNWTLWVFTRTGANMTIYKNGAILANTGSATTGSYYMSGTPRTYIGLTGSGVQGLVGRLDEFMVWNGRALTGDEVGTLYNSSNGVSCSYFVTSASTEKTWTLTVLDLFNDTGLANVNVTFDTGCWNVTNTTGSATVTNATCAGLSGTLSSVMISKTSYLPNASTYTIGENATGSAGMSQGIMNVTGITRVVDAVTLGPTLGVWSVNTTGGKNYSGGGTSYPEKIYLSNGTNTLTLHYAGSETYLDKAFSVIIAAPESTTSTVSNVSDALLTVNAVNTTGSLITGTTTITITNTTYSFSSTLNTTTGTADFYLKKNGLYNITIDNDAYAYASELVFVANASQILNVTMQTPNSVTFTFYDQQTLAFLNTTNVTVALWSTMQSANYTTSTGTLTADSLTPSEFTMRTEAVGYMTNFYSFTLTNRSHLDLPIYLLSNATATTITATVTDELGGVVEGATIYLQRYDFLNNTYNTVTIRTTNYDGQATFQAELNGEFYQWLIYYEGVLKYTSGKSQIYDTSPQFTIIIGTLPGTTRQNNTGFTYSFGPTTHYFKNSSSLQFTFNFTSSYHNVTTCSFFLLDAATDTLLNMTIAWCNVTSGTAWVNLTPTTNLRTVAWLAGSTFNNTYESYYSVVNGTSSNYSMQKLVDDLDAFTGAGFNSVTKFLIAVMAIVLFVIMTSKTITYHDNPEVIMLFIFFLSILFSYIGWFTINLSIIPLESVRQYLVSLIIGSITIIIAYRKMGVTN